MKWIQALEKECEMNWQKSIDHPFVKELATGTLDEEKFKYYLLQDAYYLKHFVQIIAASKSQTNDPATIFEIEQILTRLEASELAMRENYYPRAGLTEADFDNLIPAPAAYHYTSHLYRMAQVGDFGVTMAALLPCYALYADIANTYQHQASTNLLYKELLESYQDPVYQAAVSLQKNLVEQLAEKATPFIRKLMFQCFLISAELEYEFFEMAYQKQIWRGVNYV